VEKIKNKYKYKHVIIINKPEVPLVLTMLIVE